MVELKITDENDKLFINYEGDFNDIVNEQIQLSYLFYMNLFEDVMKKGDEETVRDCAKKIQTALYWAVEEALGEVINPEEDDGDIDSECIEYEIEISGLDEE